MDYYNIQTNQMLTLILKADYKLWKLVLIYFIIYVKKKKNNKNNNNFNSKFHDLYKLYNTF